MSWSDNWHFGFGDLVGTLIGWLGAASKHHLYESANSTKGVPRAAALAAVLARLREHSALDPFSNPILLFALDLNRRIDRGEVTLDRLEQLVQQLTADAFTTARCGSVRILGKPTQLPTKRR